MTDAVPRKAAGDIRAYERVETEPGLDKFVDDPTGAHLYTLEPISLCIPSTDTQVTVFNCRLNVCEDTYGWPCIWATCTVLAHQSHLLFMQNQCLCVLAAQLPIVFGARHICQFRHAHTDCNP